MRDFTLIVAVQNWAGEVRNVSLLVTIPVNADGHREILCICDGAKEDTAGWSGFLKHLKERGRTVFAGVDRLPPTSSISS
jgi:putative transposase